MHHGVEHLESRRLFSAQLYSIVDLGTFGGQTSVGNAVNASGEVAGRAQAKNGYNNALLYSDGTLTNLGTLGGDLGNALAINDQGDVVGVSIRGNASPQRPTLWMNGQVSAIGSVDGTATGINDAGTIVGTLVDANNSSQAFRTTIGSSQLNELGSLGGGESEALAINTGEIVGQSLNSAFVEHAFLFTNRMHDLGTLGGNAAAAALNNVGTVVGYAYTPHSRLHAFYWRKGKIHDLGTLAGNSSEALGVNDENTIVGWSTTNGQYDHAFIWIGGVMTDLNSLVVGGGGWTLSAATGINNAGDIVGYGSHDGVLSGFEMTPIDAPALAYKLPTATDLFASDTTIGDGQSVLD